MADFPIYCHVRYDTELNENGKPEIVCKDVSDHDFVEVVRCKNCKLMSHDEHGYWCINDYQASLDPEKDYCSRAVRSYSKSAKVARCGNAVCPPMAEAMVRANLPEWCGGKIETMEQLRKVVAV